VPRAYASTTAITAASTQASYGAGSGQDTNVQ
jgi:hypothetical protein